MVNDISRRTVLVLVVLTLVVSLFSMFAVVDTLKGRQEFVYMNTPEATTSNIGTAEVQLSIKQPATPVIMTGQVILKVK
ncbi:MAG: hypothetical protein AB7V77_02455 [Candidatus Woesearchaeota archaeon]